MFQRALRLRSPQAIGLNFHLSQRVAFDALSTFIEQGSWLFSRTLQPGILSFALHGIRSVPGPAERSCQISD
jgi:hypothetical protein